MALLDPRVSTPLSEEIKLYSKKHLEISIRSFREWFKSKCVHRIETDDYESRPALFWSRVSSAVNERSGLAQLRASAVASVTAWYGTGKPWPNQVRWWRRENLQSICPKLHDSLCWRASQFQMAAGQPIMYRIRNRDSTNLLRVRGLVGKRSRLGF